MRPRAFRFAVLAALLLLPACGEEQTAQAPQPQELTRAAIGHYCNMIVEDHPGPKGQIFLAGRADPIWFSSVRDTIAFTLLPEEAKNIAAIYVNDMSRASWQAPEAGTWIELRNAWYVIGSDRRGGMGAPEAVPFSERAAAQAFTVRHGGEVAALADIPADAILGEIPNSERPSGQGHAEGAMSHGRQGASDEPHQAGHGAGHGQQATQETRQ